MTSTPQALEPSRAGQELQHDNDTSFNQPKEAQQVNQFEKGEELWVLFRGLEIEGVVEDTMVNYSGETTYRVRFDDNGKSKKKWFYQENLRKKLETNE